MNENPFKYGMVLIQVEERYSTDLKVQGVCGNVVFISDIGSNNFRMDHYEDLLCYKIKRKIVHKWEDLTQDNWKEHRDKAVWMRDSEEVEGKIKILVHFRFDGSNHFLDENWSGWKHCSIYNDKGIKAEFKDE